MKSNIANQRPVRSVTPIVFLSGKTPAPSTRALIALTLQGKSSVSFTNNPFEATHIIVSFPKDAAQFTPMINQFQPEQQVIYLGENDVQLPENVTRVPIRAGSEELVKALTTLPMAA